MQFGERQGWRNHRFLGPDRMTTSKRKSHPRFQREGDKPTVALTDDDVAMLRHVYRHRFLRAEDLYRLFPDRSEDRLSRRLTLLYRAGYLDRPIAQIDRYHQGGSQSLVYGLDTVGARFLKEKFNVAIGGADWRSRNRSYTRENLDHTLGVARVMVDIELACCERPGLSLIPFEDILAAAPEATRKSKNPASWPVPVQWHGGRSVVHLAPDAIFGIRQETETGARRAYFFLEYDRGTMTIVPSEQVRESDAFPYRATVLRKLYAYADSFRAKLHEERFGLRSPRVLLLTASEERVKAMRKVALEMIVRPQRLPAALFLFGESSGELLSNLIDAGGQVTPLMPEYRAEN